jgi:hypothetical protein
MEEERSSNSKFKEKAEYFCQPCDFSTRRLGNFRRHNLTKKHRDNQQFNYGSSVQPETSLVQPHLHVPKHHEETNDADSQSQRQTISRKTECRANEGADYFQNDSDTDAEFYHGNVDGK